MLIGIYFSAISVSQDINLRQYIHRILAKDSKLLDGIETGSNGAGNREKSISDYKGVGKDLWKKKQVCSPPLKRRISRVI